MNTEILEYFSVVTSMYFHFVIVFHILEPVFFHFFFLPSLFLSFFPLSTRPHLPFFCEWSLKNFWFPGTTSLLPKE